MGGSRVNPVTAGFICSKVRRLPEHVHGTHRVRHPGVRVGRKGEGRFRRVSWDEALSLIASRMTSLAARGEGERILPFYYGGSNGYLSQNTADARLFNRLGASRMARTVCAAPSGRAVAGLYGTMPGIALQDYRHSRLVVLWGVNPSVSGIHLVPYLLEARSQGARLAVVDPRRTRLAERADLHVAPHPGTDLPLALALLRWLFENGHADDEFLSTHTTGADELRRRAEPWTLDAAARTARVPARQIEELARMYAQSTPAALRCGWGLERNRNGGSAVAAVLALPAVAGKFGVRGGGYTLSNSKAWDLDATAAAGELRPPSTREINMNLLGETLLARDGPPVELLFVYNCNPLATMPNQEKVRAGLEREDLFTVVFDPVMTDTALYADVVLPGTTFLERDEMSRGYGAMVLQEAAAVIRPVGESRPNHEVFSELTRRAGLARPGDPESAGEMKAAILRARPSGEAIRRALDSDGIAFPGGNPAPVQFVDTFPLDARPEDPPRAGGPRPRGAGRSLRVPARSGDTAVPARAHLAGDRPDDQLESRGAAPGSRCRSRWRRATRRPGASPTGTASAFSIPWGKSGVSPSPTLPCGRASSFSPRGSGGTTRCRARAPRRSRRTR